MIIPVSAGSNVLGCDLGFGELLAAGTIKAGETTVVVLTGTGLKATAFMSELFGKAPPTLWQGERS